MDKTEVIALTLRDASRISGLSVATLARMCREEKIKHIRLRKGASLRWTYLIFKDSLEELLTPYAPPPEGPKQLHLLDGMRRKPGRPLKYSWGIRS